MKIATLGLVLTAGLLVAADAKDDAKKELAKIEGTWEVTEATLDGMKAPADVLANEKITFTVKGDTFTIKHGEKTSGSGTVAIDPTQKPATLDITYTEGAHKGKKELGIYKLDGDTMTACVSEAGGKERPREFASKEGTKFELLTMKRKKQ
jgi:uncharacterized protein (TIGR03067 family)